MIDFHCHLDLYPDPQEVVRSCAQRGLYILSVTTTPSAWRGTSGLAEGHARIRTALGLHPQVAHQRMNELPLFERLIGEAKYVGEIGLDGAPEFKPYWVDQVAAFSRILDVCQGAGGRVLSLHSRRATKAVLDELARRPDAGTPVLHWFSGTARELARAVDMGCWFSIGPAMLRSQKGRDLAKQMPKGRVLTESDGPFVQIEGRSILPWEAGEATSQLADLWGETREQIDTRMEANLALLGALAGVARADG